MSSADSTEVEVATSEVAAATDADADAPPADPAQRALLAELGQALGAAIVDSHVQHADLWVRVTASAWRQAAEACRSLGFDYFCFLSGIDWMAHTWPNPKVAEEGDGEGENDDGAETATSATSATSAGGMPEGGWVTGVAGGDTRFQVLARLYSVPRRLGVTLKADLDNTEPRVDSIAEIYPGADWHERETWEMYGFQFTGHRNLVHLYLPGEFEGFPLRKDFPLLSREVKPWPGLVDVEPFPPGTDDEAGGDAPVEEAG